MQTFHLHSSHHVGTCWIVKYVWRHWESSPMWCEEGRRVRKKNKKRDKIEYLLFHDVCGWFSWGFFSAWDLCNHRRLNKKSISSHNINFHIVDLVYMSLRLSHEDFFGIYEMHRIRFYDEIFHGDEFMWEKGFLLQRGRNLGVKALKILIEKF